MNIIFQIDGGIGKSIIATAVCEAIKKKHPKDNLIVVTAYPDVFLCNPNVDKCLDFSQLSYFYSTFVDKKDCIFMLHNPYLDTLHLKTENHLIKTWCEMFEIKYNGERPRIYLTQREEYFYSNHMNFEKPLMVIQTNGGAQNQSSKYSWARDIPNKTAQQIVNYFAKDFSIAHIRRQDQLTLNNTTPIHADFRNLCVLIKNAKKRLFMDSFSQHVAKAFDTNAVVCWIGNSPEKFGYSNHINILANAETVNPELKQSLYDKYNISGDLLQFPYNDESEIFNAEEIIEALKIIE